MTVSVAMTDKMCTQIVARRCSNTPGRGRHLQGGADVGDDTCSVEGCPNVPKSWGWCGKHYMRWRRTGQLGARDKLWFPDNVYARIGPEDENGCRPWLGYVYPNDGYGRVSAPSQSGRHRARQAYRVVYELLVGPVEEGKELDHLCANKLCVNPDHLEPVDHTTNVQRGRAGEHLARRTHCPRGHPYSDENTYLYKGSRFCRECGREAKRRYKQRKKAERT